MPMVLGAAVKKAQRNYQEQMNPQKSRRPVGEVTIEKTPKKKSSTANDKDAEYVDFEEIEDK